MVTTNLYLNGKEVDSVRSVSPPIKGQVLKTRSGEYEVVNVSEVNVLPAIGNFATAIVRRVSEK